MSNQSWANNSRLFDYLTTEWSFASMITPITIAGYNTDDFLFNTNYTVEGSWCQIGGNVTKNGVTFSEGPSVNWNLSKSSKGPDFNTDTGEFTVHFSGYYSIEIKCVIKRIAGMGDRNHFIGISVNGSDPSACSSSYGVSDVIWQTVSTSCKHYFNAGDTISINYAQTEGSDEIYCAINFSILKLIYE